MTFGLCCCDRGRMLEHMDQTRKDQVNPNDLQPDSDTAPLIPCRDKMHFGQASSDGHSHANSSSGIMRTAVGVRQQGFGNDNLHFPYISLFDR